MIGIEITPENKFSGPEFVISQEPDAGLHMSIIRIDNITELLYLREEIDNFLREMGFKGPLVGVL